jgi:hypothetical protein
VLFGLSGLRGEKDHQPFWSEAHVLVRVLAVVEFSREMATGQSASGYIENGNWQQVEPQSVDQALWDAVCRNT